MDMSKMLGKKVEDAKRLPQTPKGMRKLLVTSYKAAKSSKKGTDGIEVTFKQLEAGNDVNEMEEARYIEEIKTGGYKLEELEKKDTFWITEAPFTLVRLREFIEACGVDITGRTFEEALPDVKGSQVWGTIVWEAIDGRPGEFRDKISQFHRI